MNIVLDLYYIIGFVAVLFMNMILLILISIRTHAIQELKASFSNATLLFVDTGSDYVLTTTKDDYSTGILKASRFFFIKTRDSIKRDREKHLKYGFASISVPYTIGTEIAAITQKASTEEKPIFSQLQLDDKGEVMLDDSGNVKMIEGVSAEKDAEGNIIWKPIPENPKIKKLSFAGISIALDKVIYFFSSITPSQIQSLVQREVLEQSADLRKFDWKVVLYVVLFMIGAGVVYIIIRGNNPATPTINIDAGTLRSIMNTTILSG